MCSPKRHVSNYIVVLRQPLDIRLAFMRIIRQAYNVDDVFDLAFDDVYTLDEFIPVPLSICQLAQGEPMTYEQYVAQWTHLAASHAANVLVVFYEALVVDPKTQLRRICEFVGAQPSRDTVDELVAAVFEHSQEDECGSAILRCSRASLRFVECQCLDAGMGTYEDVFEDMTATKFPFRRTQPPSAPAEPASAEASPWAELGRKTVISARLLGNAASSLARKGQASLKEKALRLHWSPIAPERRLAREERAMSKLTPDALREDDWGLSSTLFVVSPPPAETPTHNRQSSTSTVASSVRLSDKFATHTAMEDKAIKEKLEQLKYRKSIIGVVADGEALSEML